MKILMINLHSSRNAGDDVLTRVSVDLLQRHFPNAQITLAMNDPESYAGPGVTVGSFMSWIKPVAGSTADRAAGFLALPFSPVAGIVYRALGLSTLKIVPRRYRPLLQAYFEADLVISAAGNFLYSGGRFGFALLMSLYVMAFAWLIGKPIYTMPQTVGPIERRHERWLLSWMFKRVRLVYVRDPISRTLLQELKVWHAGCAVAPDVAFVFPGDSESTGLEVLQTAGTAPHTPRLGVTLINWQAQNRTFRQQEVYETAVAAAARAFVTHTNGQVILFAQVRGPTPAEDDRIPAQRVAAMLADLGDQVVLIEQEEIPAAALKAAYGLMDIFIGTRLHSNIFALTAGTPAVMIQYQYKTRGVVQMLGLEEWVVEIEQVSAALLTEKMLALWARREVVEREIQQAVTAVARQVEQIGAHIAADFRTLS